MEKVKMSKIFVPEKYANRLIQYLKQNYEVAESSYYPQDMKNNTAIIVSDNDILAVGPHGAKSPSWENGKFMSVKEIIQKAFDMKIDNA